MGVIDRLSRFSVFLPLSLVVALGVATLISLIRFGTTAVDEVARGHMKERVEVAMAVERQRLADLLVEYSFWNIAWEQLVDELDLVWADDNIGNYLFVDAEVDLAFVIDSDDRPVIAFLDGDQVHPGAIDEFLKRTRRAIALSRTDMSEPTPQLQYLAVDGVVYLLALDTFISEEYAPREPDGSVIAFARRVDAARINDIGELYRIPGLGIANDRDAVLPSLRLDLGNFDGQALLTLSWDDQTPANNMRRTLRPYIISLGVAMTALIFWVFYLEIRSHRERESLLREVASIDHLTGVRNRREFFVDASRALAASRRAGQPASLVLLDVDNFKRVNDTMGHAAGDRLLSLVGEHLRGQLRQTDIFARYGGDEFVVLLPGMDTVAAWPLAERLRMRIAEDAPRVIAEAGGTAAPCTVSIGIAGYQEGEGLEHLIARADEALYEAKHGGRDKTVSLTTDEHTTGENPA